LTWDKECEKLDGSGSKYYKRVRKLLLTCLKKLRNRLSSRNGSSLVDYNLVNELIPSIINGYFSSKQCAELQKTIVIENLRWREVIEETKDSDIEVDVDENEDAGEYDALQFHISPYVCERHLNSVMAKLEDNIGHFMEIE